MTTRTTIAAAAALLLGSALAVAPAAHAASGPAAQPVHPISPGDPYAACTAGATPDGTVYPGSEVEPWIATDPHHPGRVISVYQQDRWSDGGAKGVAASYSRDGRHFTKTTLPFSKCAPGGLNYERASDAWVDFGPDGVAYASGLDFDVSTARNGVGAATSFDGGRTWSRTTQLIDDTDPSIVDDKNSVTADPRHPGTAYQVWDRIDQVTTGSGAHYTGPSYIAITRDHGRTWTPAHPFVDTGVVPNSQTIGNVIVADARRDVLYDFFEWQTYSGVDATQPVDLHFAVVASKDQGRTWSKPVTIAPDTSVPEVDPNAPDDPAKALRGGANLISAAVDPRTGELYGTFEGADPTGSYDQIQLVHSTDAGRTWSAPVRVNQAPAAPAFTPSIAVDARGTVAITYVDLRYLQPGDTTTLPTAMWYLTFPRGGENRPSERRISRVFDWLKAPYAGWGHFLGDYESVAATGHGFQPAVIETNDTGPAVNSTDLFTGIFGANPASAAPAPASPAPHLTTARHLNAHRTQH
ncbi:sialidase family protein [Actinomadura verrucosospora]|uniref:BNR/Asp-box repeat-containing protein n=1 Tax=Actinomadura verrucosospora TaxID=46165 RepID=A0A7D3VSZ0_ACTVE|nr:sialidase family protein [Actinomadura verrucosospora]QKG19216.1 BNR/Asp-box repeat-containing protein [Actinomadura verrucosospora]